MSIGDWFLDPPESPEPPMCPEGCGGYADEETMEQKDGKLHCTCDECGRKWAMDDPYDYPDPPAHLPDPKPEENTCRACGKPTDCIFCSDKCTPDCPHGNRPGDCDACDHLGDLAYDAAR